MGVVTVRAALVSALDAHGADEDLGTRIKGSPYVAQFTLRMMSHVDETRHRKGGMQRRHRPW